MKQPIRSFSIGLLTAGLICLLVFYFSGGNKETANLSTEDMIAKLEDEGYRVFTESEYISMAVDSDDADETEADTDDDSALEDNEEDEADEDSEADDEDASVTYTLEIKSGMNSSEISELLEENDIIDDAMEFSTFLEDEDYESDVQIGEFELSSDMSFKEIAEEITK
ncbi:MAG TPA: hypothetical protein VK136_02020 [Bacillota bacterium]|nr:hypothetical protein [Bacillota bacterium]